MGYREVQNYKAFMAEEAAREQAEREERERPMREAEAQLVKNSNALALLERDRVAGVNGLKDDDVWIDPALEGVRMTVEQATAYNEAQAAAFSRDFPELCWSKANAAKVIDYHKRHDIKLISYESLKRVFSRLQSFGQLEERPVPEPEPEPIPEPEPESTGPKMVKGWDDDGREIELTERQVERLSADEYKRFARVSVRRFPSHAAF